MRARSTFQFLVSCHSYVKKHLVQLNLLVHDGEFLYAHTNFRDSLHYLEEDGAVTFSTCPLSDGDWKPVPFTRLVAVKDGEFVREGTPHRNEYIYNPDDYRLVYMNFARL